MRRFLEDFERFFFWLELFEEESEEEEEEEEEEEDEESESEESPSCSPSSMGVFRGVLGGDRAGDGEDWLCWGVEGFGLGIASGGRGCCCARGEFKPSWILGCLELEEPIKEDLSQRNVSV